MDKINEKIERDLKEKGIAVYKKGRDCYGVIVKRPYGYLTFDIGCD